MSGQLSGIIDRRLIRHFDWGLFISVLAIPFLGLIVLYSAGFDPDATGGDGIFGFIAKSKPFLKQLIFLGAGTCVMLLASAISSQYLNRYAYIIYGIGVALLVAVLLFGTVVNGSRRWIPLPAGFMLQPAELMKLGIILCVARFISKHPPLSGPYGLKQLLLPLSLIGVPMLLIMKQPDLGSALAVGMIGFAMILFMGIRTRLMVITAIIGAVLAPFAWHHLHDYQQRRIMTLFNPEADPRGSGYHITQSIIAVGSGELSGKGFMQGTQTQLEFLPEHHTDFIFSVLAEEWGFLGALALIGLYINLIYRLLRVGMRSKDLFSAMLPIGMAAFFTLHASINIGMVIGLLPVVGIPLPLFSYGGSATITLMFGMGVVLGVSMRRHIFSQGV